VQGNEEIWFCMTERKKCRKKLIDNVSNGKEFLPNQLKQGEAVIDPMSSGYCQRIGRFLSVQKIGESSEQ